MSDALLNAACLVQSIKCMAPLTRHADMATILGAMQEVAVLARCDCPNITRYFASVLRPGSSELFIVMELMALSVADLVSPPSCLIQHDCTLP